MTNSRASRAQASCHFSSVICHWSFRGRAGSGSLGTPLSERQCPSPPATTTLPLPWEEPLKLTFLPTRRHAGANSAVLELHPAAPFAHLTSDFSGDCLSYRPNTGQEYEAKVLHAATSMEFSLQAAPTPKAR